MIRSLAALLLALTVPAAPALAQPAAPRLSEEAAGQLVTASSRLRFDFAASSRAALGPLTAEEARLLSERLGLGEPLARGAWERVIGASTQFARITADGAETLWWNAMVDAGVALRWRRDASGWRIVAAAPYLGETLRGSRMTLGADMLGDLRRAASATRAAFRTGAAARLFGADPPVGAMIARAAAAQGSLFASLNGIAPVADRQIVAEQLLIRSSGLSPDLAGHLAGMPSEARMMLAPQRRFADATGESVVWASAGAPDSLLVLQYPNDPAALAPRMILAVDLIVREERPQP